MSSDRQKLKTVSLEGTLISAAVWIALSFLFALANVSLFGYYIGEFLAITLGGVPAAFLQLRLCLADKARWVRWIPAALAAAMPLLAAFFACVVGGFGGGLLGIILIVFSLAPAAGVCIGWIAHGKRLALIPLNILFIVFLVFNGIPFATRPIDLADFIALIYLLAGIFLAFVPAEKREPAEASA